MRFRNRNSDRKDRSVSSVMKNSLYFVFIMILVLSCVLIARLIYLNSKNGDQYAKAVLSQQSYSSTTIASERGRILDRNGIVLARNEKIYNVVIDAKVLGDEDHTYYRTATVPALVTALGYDEDEINRLIDDNKGNAYIVYERDIEYSRVAAYKEYANSHKHVAGVWFEEEYRRVYPFSTLASHVIGFTTSDGQGSYGIEEYYNSYLCGTDGLSYGYYDSELNMQATVKDAIDGDDIVSTIDYNIQTVIEERVNDFLDETGCKNIGIIVMDPNNGEILGMASNREFDLNSPRSLAGIYSDEEISAMTDTEKVNALYGIWRNFCISDTYEPGSTYKTITVASALEEDAILTTDTFYCGGSTEVGGWTIGCNNKYGHGNLSVAESLMKSCNCALIAIADKLGADEFYKYQQTFGFGRKTGIDLTGEASGITISRKNLNVTELATSSFGTTFNVTMIQMAAAYASIINGGTYYQPHVVREIRNSDGTGSVKTTEEALRQTVSESTSEFIRNALYMTVESGTATPAKVSGYLIGGKTGTAQKRPRDEKKYVVSFVGFAPVDDPQVMIYIVIDEAYDEELAGSSSLATRMSASIFKSILPYMGMYPDGYDIEYTYDLNLIIDDDNDIYDPSQDEMNPDVIPDMIDETVEAD